MSRKVTVDQMEKAIMDELNEYANLAAEDMKSAVQETAKSVRKDIQSGAPVRAGAYKRSWSVKKMNETSNSLTMVVHSRNRYQIAHLLEHGHAKRNGGRTRAIPHIKPAEERGEEELTRKIKEKLR